MAGPLNEFTQVAKFDPETFGDPGRERSASTQKARVAPQRYGWKKSS